MAKKELPHPIWDAGALLVHGKAPPWPPLRELGRGSFGAASQHPPRGSGDWPQNLHRKSQAKNAVLFQQTILRYFVHFGQHEKATRQSPAGSLCFIVLFLCYFRVLCVRFSLKYERTGAARPPPPSTRPAPCSHSARLKPSLGSCSSRFGFARSPPVIPRRASSLSGATAE